jgi:hypothetical protein
LPERNFAAWAESWDPKVFHFGYWQVKPYRNWEIEGLAGFQPACGGLE